MGNELRAEQEGREHRQQALRQGIVDHVTQQILAGILPLRCCCTIFRDQAMLNYCNLRMISKHMSNKHRSRFNGHKDLWLNCNHIHSP
jgi:hypothetical protein